MHVTRGFIGIEVFYWKNVLERVLSLEISIERGVQQKYFWRNLSLSNGVRGIL